MKLAIVGATGAVGEVMLQILGEKKFKFDELILFSSERSAGRKIHYNGREFIVRKLEDNCFDKVDIALFSAGGDISRKYCPLAAKAGALVIDNSSAFRMSEDIPLVVPEVNPEMITKCGIIANPNCTTIILVTVLNRIFKEIGIEKIIVSSYQSASGAGAKGVNELLDQERDFVNNNSLKVNNFKHQLLHNVIPQIGNFTENGFTEEEMKMVNETKKITGDYDLKISATCVRVPVLTSHSESVFFTLKKDVSKEKLIELLSNSPGVVYSENENDYPMPLFTSGKDICYAGRLRKDNVFENGWSLWITGDQLRKGAALNAIQIAEYARV
ncbi:MAG: aspartate-semialdehyde dehydrogenase [Candidatus Delongbacteria bacterium]|nr:aspartate-semialdehyde dehydrogenase [Candidatus Delongbacteria bacterium]MBN2833681.1 aspartate-semialdehyde dehydrogenase [Candidatus Delongbacteria bacterium]